jgi:hypothetical protein
VFHPRGDDKNKTYYNCGEKGHISNNCPKPNKRKSSHKIKHHQDSSDDDDDNKKGKHKSYEKKKSYYKKTKLFLKKKGEIKKNFVVGTQEWVTDVSSSEDSSDEDDIAGVSLTDFEPPLPPPPMCLMAKGNSKVSDGESRDSDGELDPNEFSNLVYVYTSVIKREKSKLKQLESADATLEASHNNLLSKYNELLKRHDESIVCAKQVDERYDKLKVEHKELTQKYHLLEVAYEVLDQSFEHSTIENVVKVNVSTSCDDLLNKGNATNVFPEIVTYREKKLMDQVASLKTSVDRLTRGEIMHKEILFYHAHDYGKRGLGSFPETSKGTIPSLETKPSFIKKVGSYCQHCQVTGHHTRECTLHILPFPTLPKNSSMFENNHFLLSKVKEKVKVKFIGKLTKDEKKRLPKQRWVPKALVTRVKGSKLVWIPKAEL